MAISATSTGDEQDCPTGNRRAAPTTTDDAALTIIRNCCLRDRQARPARSASADWRVRLLAFFSRSREAVGDLLLARRPGRRRRRRAFAVRLLASACAALVRPRRHRRAKTKARPPTPSARSTANERRITMSTTLARQNASTSASTSEQSSAAASALLLAVIARAVPEARPADAGRAMLALQLALRVLAEQSRRRTGPG